MIVKFTVNCGHCGKRFWAYEDIGIHFLDEQIVAEVEKLANEQLYFCSDPHFQAWKVQNPHVPFTDERTIKGEQI